MSKKQAAAILIVVVVVLGVAVFYRYQAETPAVQDEFTTVDAWFSDLDDFLDFENEDRDYDLSEISGDWG